MIKMNVLLRMLFLFQTIPIITLDVPFKQRQRERERERERLKFIWQSKKPRVKMKIYKQRKGVVWERQILKRISLHVV